ncbi:hypothetical protein AURDEDRAFT_131403, partial [Auricularia subglabra TFB-10046 SS5]
MSNINPTAGQRLRPSATRSTSGEKKTNKRRHLTPVIEIPDTSDEEPTGNHLLQCLQARSAHVTADFQRKCHDMSLINESAFHSLRLVIEVSGSILSILTGQPTVSQRERALESQLRQVFTSPCKVEYHLTDLQLESDRQDLRRSLECGVCLDLNLKPYMLGCGHSFCESCLGTLIITDVLLCPTCRGAINRRPIPNHGLKDVVDEICVQDGVRLSLFCVTLGEMLYDPKGGCLLRKKPRGLLWLRTDLRGGSRAAWPEPEPARPDSAFSSPPWLNRCMTTSVREGAFLRHLLRLSNADARSQPDEGVEARCAEASSHRGQPEAVDEVCGASDLKLKHNDELPIYYLDGSCVGRTGADLTRELTGGRWVRVDCEFVVWSMNDDSGSTRTFQLAVERMVVLSRLPGSAPPSGKSRIEGEGLT